MSADPAAVVDRLHQDPGYQAATPDDQELMDTAVTVLAYAKHYGVDPCEFYTEINARYRREQFRLIRGGRS